MTQALRLKSGELVNPERFNEDQLIEFCAAGALWEEVPPGFFAPVEVKVTNSDGSEPQRDADGLIHGEPLPQDHPMAKAAAKKAAAKKGD